MTKDPSPPHDAPNDASNVNPPDTTPPARRAPVRSFVLRAGRTGPGQRRALDELAPRFVLPFSAQPPAWHAVFGRQAPRVVEIGFGMGDATAQVAAAQPGVDFIGIEVHEPGVGALLKRIGERGLTNLRIVRHDAVDVLHAMVEPASLAAIHLWFPDPWPKKRHHKRRLVQPAFVALAASRLAPGGTLHCATDWQPYAEQMLQVLSQEPLLRNTVPADAVADPGDTNRPVGAGYAERPGHRPLTKFEQRGLGLGHGVWDLVFSRTS